MKSPELFFMRRRCMIPLEATDYEKVLIVSESRPFITSLGNIAIIKSHFPIYPIWDVASDGTRGTFNLVTSKADEIIPLEHREGEEILAPASTDGLVIRDGEPAVICTGITKGTEFSVWWGITTAQLDINSLEQSVLLHTTSLRTDQFGELDKSFRS